MFRTVTLSIIRNFSLYTQQRYMSYSLHLQLASRIRTELPDPARKLSANLYNIYHCCVYSEKLLMMDRGTSSILILLASCQQTCMPYTTAVCTVKNC